MATWTGALSKPTGYTTYPKTVTASGSSSTLQPIVNTATTTPDTGYGQSYTKTANGEVDNKLLEDYSAKYGTEARDAVLGYFNDKDTYLSNNGMAGLENYMKNWYDSRQPAATTPTQAATKSTPETTTASTSAVQGANKVNSQADALSNNVNEGENKAKQTMTVQSGSDMGGVNYTNADSDNTTSSETTSSDSVMPSATPTNQKYASWIQNASTFGTSDENEKTSANATPLTLTKTVYWSRRKK